MGPCESSSPYEDNMRIFLSYSHDDKKYAKKLAGALEDNGFIIIISNLIEKRVKILSPTYLLVESQLNNPFFSNIS